MIDLNDKIIKIEKDGKSRSLYKCYCDDCGKDRGYHRNLAYKISAKCQQCSQRKDVSNISNVDKEDKKVNKIGKILYRTKCIECNKDRGYKPPHDSNKKCLSCAAKLRQINMSQDIKDKIAKKVSATHRGITVEEFDEFTNSRPSIERRLKFALVILASLILATD